MNKGERGNGKKKKTAAAAVLIGAAIVALASYFIVTIINNIDRIRPDRNDTAGVTDEKLKQFADIQDYLTGFKGYEFLFTGLIEQEAALTLPMIVDKYEEAIQTVEIGGTRTDGETITVSTPDGVSLINPTHTCNGSSNTFSNEISTTHTPIATDVFEALEEKFNGFLDQADGRNVPVIPDTVITGRHAPTVHMVKRILHSDKLQGTTDNDKNTLKTNSAGTDYRHIVVPMLDFNCQTEQRDSDKHRYCFLASLGGEEERGIVAEVSQDIRFEPPEQVFESSTWEFMSTGLYDFGVLFANFIAGTKGDGNAV